jgi:hypothetical protein
MMDREHWLTGRQRVGAPARERAARLSVEVISPFRSRPAHHRESSRITCQYFG